MRVFGKKHPVTLALTLLVAVAFGCQGNSSSTNTGSAASPSTQPAGAGTSSNSPVAGGGLVQQANGGNGASPATSARAGSVTAVGGSGGAAAVTSSGGDSGSGTYGGTNGSSGTVGKGGNTFTGGSGVGGLGASSAGVAGLSTTASGTSGGSSQGGTSAGQRRPKICDATGQNCKCISLASFGAIASAAYGEGVDGTPSSTTAFSVWLAETTNAAITMVQTQPAITPQYLAQFDVILLQDLRKWNLSAVERAAIADWVKGGGGIVALSGYFNEDDAEVIAVNQVLSFSGMSYNGGSLSGSVPGNSCPESSKILCPQALGLCCYCWNNTIPITYLVAEHPLTKNIKAIGAYFGRGISPGDATVVMRHDTSVVGATKSVGVGKLFLFADEWVTYTSQWVGGSPPMGAADAFNPCYDAGANPPHYLSADKVFQVKQFWYNAIRYVAPLTECKFVVSDPEVIVQ